jgi:hypothetical protein
MSRSATAVSLLLGSGPSSPDLGHLTPRLFSDHRTLTSSRVTRATTRSKATYGALVLRIKNIQRP